MTEPSTALPSSVLDLFVELSALEASINDELDTGMRDLRVYPLQPVSTLEPPAIFNELLPSTAFTLPDASRSRDREEIFIGVRLVVERNLDTQQQMFDLLAYADIVRRVIDINLAKRRTIEDACGPLNGSCVEAHRDRMNRDSWTIGGISYPGIEFRIQASLERYLR